MEIGGYDISIKHPARERKDVYAIACLFLRQSWKDLVIEDADTGKDFGVYLHDCDSIMIYKDEVSRKLWDKLGCVQETENTMIHLFCKKPTETTIVVDDKKHSLMKKFIDEMNMYLHKGVFTLGFGNGLEDVFK